MEHAHLPIPRMALVFLASGFDPESRLFESSSCLRWMLEPVLCEVRGASGDGRERVVQAREADLDGAAEEGRAEDVRFVVCWAPHRLEEKLGWVRLGVWRLALTGVAPERIHRPHGGIRWGALGGGGGADRSRGGPGGQGHGEEPCAVHASV